MGKDGRIPKEIVRHMYDVMCFTRMFFETKTLPQDAVEGKSFNNTIERFRTEMCKLDELLDKENPEMAYSKRLIQGSFSDALTHIGQIAFCNDWLSIR
jgi:hypothetical protein